MPLPTHHYDRFVSQIGKWRIHIQGDAEGRTPYQVFWIVDDKHVHFDLLKIDRLYRIGDSLQVKARLLYDGKQLAQERIQESTVRMAEPRVDIEKFLQEYQVDPVRLRKLRKEMEAKGLASDIDLKRYALNLDHEAVMHCTQVNTQSLPLTCQKDGLVTRVKFARPGIHQFDLHVTALDPKGHLITRTRTLNVWVGSGECTLKKT